MYMVDVMVKTSYDNPFNLVETICRTNCENCTIENIAWNLVTEMLWK